MAAIIKRDARRRKRGGAPRLFYRLENTDIGINLVLMFTFFQPLFTMRERSTWYCSTHPGDEVDIGIHVHVQPSTHRHNRAVSPRAGIAGSRATAAAGRSVFPWFVLIGWELTLIGREVAW